MGKREELIVKREEGKREEGRGKSENRGEGRVGRENLELSGTIVNFMK